MIKTTPLAPRWAVGTLCLSLAATAALWNGASVGQTQPKASAGATKEANKPPTPPKDRDLQKFMRKKLAASNLILEGLCTEDLGLVADGAKQLQELSEAEQWQVSNDVMYKQSSNEFRQIAKQLLKAAEEGNADRATLKWLDATVSCLDCHRFVRGIRLVDSPSR